MGTVNNTLKSGLFFITAIVVTSLSFWVTSPTAWGGPTVTLCTDKATHEGFNGTYKIGASKKLKTDGTPLFSTYTTTSNNPSMNRNADLVLIPAPVAGCKLNTVVINTDSACKPLAVTDPPSAPHPVEVHFNGCSSGTGVYFPDVQADADALTPANALENTYNAARTLLGMDGLPNLPATCSNPGSEQDLKDCAGFICNNILDQVQNGDKQAQENAGNLGQLIGALQADSWACFARSGKVEVHSDSGCTVEDVIRNGGIEALTMAPAVDLDANVFSNGAGLLSVTDLGGGSFASIDMATCIADFLINQ